MHRNGGVIASTLIGLSLILAACGSQQAQVAVPTSAPATAKPAAPLNRRFSSGLASRADRAASWSRQRFTSSQSVTERSATGRERSG